MIKVENLQKTYDRRTKNENTVLHGLSFELPDTGFVCILGASGCGKTSLLNAVGGLDSFDSGRITTDDAVITRSGSSSMERERNASFGYIFQNYYLLAEHSATYNIFLGMHSLPISKKEKMKRIRDALERVDMLRYRKRPVGQLSGGQQQRIAIARAIARRPKVIFADEPTGNLDEANTMNICTILKELSRDSLVIMVTHEERIARFFADRIITLEEGSIISDSTDWARGTIDAGEKDALYTDDYEESTLSSDEISIRVLKSDNAASVKLTLVTENNRIIIKVDDPRVVLCTEANASPKIIEGERPVLSIDGFNRRICENSAKAPKMEKTKEKSRGLGIRFLIMESRSLVQGKKLKRFGTGIFIVLLSLMISLSISDIITVSHIEPEDFITTDSHILEFAYKRGSSLPQDIWDISPYVEKFANYLEGSDLDFDFVPKNSVVLEYKDNTVPQFGRLSMKFSGYSYVNISRIDKAKLIHGRMPERSDEIVIDRWVIDRALEEEGVIQNIIPASEYFVGKTLSCTDKTIELKIVGICDSGEPSIYMSREAILSLSVGGLEVMGISEFCRITGYNKYDELGEDEYIAITQNAGTVYNYYIGTYRQLPYGRTIFVKDALQSQGIGARFIVSDATVDALYDQMIGNDQYRKIWCTDKAAVKEFLDNEFPSELNGLLNAYLTDEYEDAYTEYLEKTEAKVDARMIVTVTVLMLSFIMLYLMQRSKIKERMDLVAVYRLLGIPKRNLMFIFAVESLILTLKYSIPTVILSWLGINIISSFEEIGISMIYPYWAMGITLLSIIAVRLLIAVIPVLRLLSEPPARLAARYDF